MVMVHIAKLVFELFLTGNGHDDCREAALLVHVESNLGSIAFPRAVVAAIQTQGAARSVSEIGGFGAAFAFVKGQIHAIDLQIGNQCVGFPTLGIEVNGHNSVCPC